MKPQKMRQHFLIAILIIGFVVPIKAQNKSVRSGNDLFKFVATQELEKAAKLINQGVPIQGKDSLERTLLHLITEYNNLDIYGFPRFFLEKMLLEKRISVNSQDNKGNTALLNVISFSQSETIIKLLYLYGADFSIRNKKGKSALDLAKATNKKYLISLVEKLAKTPNFPRKTTLKTYINFDKSDEKHPNSYFFEAEKRVSKILLNALQQETISAYVLDDEGREIKQLTKKEVWENLKLPTTISASDTSWCGTDDSDADWETTEEITTGNIIETAAYYFPSQLSLIALRESVSRSVKGRLRYKTQYLDLYLPANQSIKGIDTYLFSFKFEDCQKLFSENPLAVWDNMKGNSFGNVLHISSYRQDEIQELLFGKQSKEKNTALELFVKEKEQFQLKRDTLSYDIIPDSICLLQTKEGGLYSQKIKAVSLKEFQEKLKNSYWQYGENALKLNYAEAISQRRFIPYYGEEKTDLFITKSGKEKLKNSSKKENKNTLLYARDILSDISLLDKKNKVLTTKKNIFLNIVLKAVKNEKLTPFFNYQNIFSNEKLEKQLIENFWRRIVSEMEEKENPKLKNAKMNKHFRKDAFQKIQLLGLVDQLIFDEKGKRTNYKINYISLIIPAKFQENGINKTVAYFKYDELSKVLKRKKKKVYTFLESRKFLKITWETSSTYLVKN